MFARHRRILFALALSAFFVAVLAPSGVADTRTERYDMPSSFVVRGIFGFGIVVCATEGVPEEVSDAARNGPCIDYSGSEERPFTLTVEDDNFDSTSITIAVDIDGDGCVSSSCAGVPNDVDYRQTGCGSLSGVLPTPQAGGESMMQTFIRVADLDPDTLEFCSGSSGSLVIVIS